GDLVHREHGGRKPGGGPEEIATGHPGPGGIGVHALADALTHMTSEEERGPLLFRGHRATRGPLVSLEVLEDIELHTLPPDRINGQTAVRPPTDTDPRVPPARVPPPSCPASSRRRATRTGRSTSAAPRRSQARFSRASSLSESERQARVARRWVDAGQRSEEHTSELQSLRHLVCRLLLE